ncbi:hypothetical protein BDV39DRAFT_191043 [Aspergillus sergii]|uniref:Uncharacterized protein n=1 Tax=Aspergillus sergii TaxID=1034303 RepID=A0A5N6XBK9_9EURO|nr:hypothetical protein BDV39DRAFT_191043 [Aspergillus sergii]
MGTGITNPSRDSSPHFRHVFRDSFLRRGFDTLMSNLDTKPKWLQMVEELDDTVRSDYMRLDVSLKDVPCTIDNAGAIDDYRNLVVLQPGSSYGAACCSILFCFGRCKGPVKQIVGALQKLHPQNLEFSTDTEPLGRFGGMEDTCPNCGRYFKPVSILIHHPDEAINIYVRINKHKHWRINGFPSSISSFINTQKLQYSFGRPDHGQPAAVSCHTCDGFNNPLRGRRRKRTSAQSMEEHEKKRVCIVEEVRG